MPTSDDDCIILLTSGIGDSSMSDTLILEHSEGSRFWRQSGSSSAAFKQAAKMTS